LNGMIFLPLATGTVKTKKMAFQNSALLSII